MKEPAYLLLYRRLRQEIISGALPLNSRLPSRRNAALESGLSTTTVLRAYDLLCDEGYILSRDRSGYYVCYREQDLAALPPALPILPPPHGNDTPGAEQLPWPQYARTMRRVLSAYGPALLEKAPNKGCMALRSVLCAYLAAERGITAEPDRVIIGSGAEYLYGLIVQTLGRDRLYALEDPAYPMIRRVYEANGAHCEALPMDSEGILPQALVSSRAGVLHVTPFRSYPSGVTASASRRAEYVRWAQQRGGLIVEDDFDSAFTPSSKAEDTVYALSEDGRVIYMSTFTRTISPALRVGFMVLPQRLLGPFEERVGFYTCTVPVPEQYLLAELIRSGEYTRHVNRIRRMRRRN